MTSGSSRDWAILSTAFCREVHDWLVEGIGDQSRCHSALLFLTSFLQEEGVPLESLFTYGELVDAAGPSGEPNARAARFYEEVRLAVSAVKDFRMLMSADTFSELDSDKEYLRNSVLLWSRARLAAGAVPSEADDRT
ncbi:MAG: hypothetical protein ACOYOQ_15205 [Microthrixaceae bacterium]